MKTKPRWKGLHNTGIDAATVENYLMRYGRGWVAEDDGRPVGFAVSDGRDGSVFALFVRPESEGKGFGSALLKEAVGWLIAQGFDRPWLEVGAGHACTRVLFDQEPEVEVCAVAPEGSSEAESRREDGNDALSS